MKHNTRTMKAHYKNNEAQYKNNEVRVQYKNNESKYKNNNAVTRTIKVTRTMNRIHNTENNTQQI
jgi:hypothetical protein